MSITSIEEARAKAAIEASKSGQMSTVMMQSIVAVSGELEKTDERLYVEIPIPHPPGTSDAAILNAAFQGIKNIGGLVVSDDAHAQMDFIPAVKFKKLHFELKKVSLAI